MNELGKLKRQAKNLMLRIRREESDSEVDCGRHLLETIRPHIRVMKQKFSEIWARIRLLDKTAPADPYRSE